MHLIYNGGKTDIVAMVGGYSIPLPKGEVVEFGTFQAGNTMLHEDYVVSHIMDRWGMHGLVRVARDFNPDNVAPEIREACLAKLEEHLNGVEENIHQRAQELQEADRRPERLKAYQRELLLVRKAVRQELEEVRGPMEKDLLDQPVGASAEKELGQVGTTPADDVAGDGEEVPETAEDLETESGKADEGLLDEDPEPKPSSKSGRSARRRARKK